LAALQLPAWADQTVTSTETLIRLNVPPMAAPKPALRYMLLPELKEMSPGNPIPDYLRCVLAHEATSEDFALDKFALREADRAARLDKPDWQILLKAKSDGVNLLLPDVQKMRQLAAGLQDRLRDEGSHRRFDDAVVTVKTMLAMSRHMGEHPTLIGDLVGIAIAAITFGPFEEMLEQPGCPNFYWALTSLPSPFISLDKGMEGERLLIGAELRGLDDTNPMNKDQIKKMLVHIDRLRELEGQNKKEKTTRELLDEEAKQTGFLDAARRRLIDSGLSEERLKLFPADQVLLLDAKLEYEIRRDEYMKLLHLPYSQSQELLTKVESDKAGRQVELFGFLIPSIHKVRQAQVRLEQRIALLRHVEALRMYAAAHEGKLPEKLSDVAVPLPEDPVTGKPYLYSLEGSTAHLRNTAPKGAEMNPGSKYHYELTIQK